MDLTNYVKAIRGITFTCWKCGKETYLTSAQVMAMALPDEELFDFRRRWECECKALCPNIQAHYAGVAIGSYGRRGKFGGRDD